MSRSGRQVAGTAAPFLLVALTVVSGTQRFSLASVPPLTTPLSTETGLDAFGIGLATTVTVIVMALGSPLSAGLTHLISRERLLAWGAAAVVVGCAIRAVPPLSVTLFVGAVIGGLGIATVSTMIPGVIAEHLPRRVGVAVGSTTFALTFVAVVVSSFTAPLATRLGTAGALAAWAIPALVALVIWLPFTRGSRTTPGGRTRMPWRSASAWLLVLVMLGQCIAFLLSLAWVAPNFQESGLSLEMAGFLLGAVTLGNMTGAMLSPVITRGDGGDRRPVFLIGLAFTILGGVYLAIGATTGALLVMLALGLGLGSGFGVLLSLLIDLGDSPRSTAALSAMVFLLGNLISAPVVAIGGWLRDATGSFSAMWWLVVVAALAQVPLAIALGPHRRASVTISTANSEHHLTDDTREYR